MTVCLSGKTLYHGVSELSESHIECIALVHKFSECKQDLHVLILTNLLSDNGM